jgi:hypothetical protein
VSIQKIAILATRSNTLIEEVREYFSAVPISELQSQTFLSPDADATSLPSGENATART